MRCFLALVAALGVCLTLQARGATDSQLQLPNVIVDRIEISGVSSIESADVEAAIEVNVGENLERSRVIRSGANLKELYRQRGFEKVTLKSELVRERSETGKAEMVLKFSIDEGKPSRVSEVEIVPEFKGLFQSQGDNRIRKYWETQWPNLKEKLSVRPGDICDMERISAMRRSLQEVLISEEFFGSRVLDPEMLEDHEPALTAPPGATEKWVKIRLRVQLGDRVTFGFQGNSFFTWGYLSSLVTETKALGLGPEYVKAIADRIRDEYKNVGFLQAQVKVYSHEKPGAASTRHISFVIEEGKRHQLVGIEFDGNMVFSSKALQDRFYQLASVQVKHGVFVEKDIDRATDLLIEWIKSQGYLNARLIAIHRLANPKFPEKFRLMIYLFEGIQTFVGGFEIKGTRPYSDQELRSFRETLGVEIGKPLNLFALSEGIETLKSMQRASGYLDFKVINEKQNEVVQYSSDQRQGFIKLEIEDGAKYRVSRVEIEGLQKTKENVVRREIKIQPGDVLEETRLTEIENRLRRLGVFASAGVSLHDDPDHPDQKIVRVSIQEGTPGLVAGGVGFRNDLGARVFGQGSYSNIWHENHTVLLNLAANRRFDEQYCSNAKPGESFSSGNCFVEAQAQLGYVWPWFVGLPEVTFRPRVTVERTQFRAFDADSISVAPIWERNLIRSPNLTGVMTYSLERVKQYHAQDKADNGEFTLGSIIPSLYLDMRDKPLAPTRGLYTSLSYEVADPAFLTQRKPVPLGYTRALFRSDFFVPLAEEVSLFFSFRTGIERNTQKIPPGDPDPKRYQIPISKQFTLGGAGSLRGFKEQELNIADVSLFSSLSFVNYRAQLDLPFNGPLRVGPFLDAGNLIVDRYSFGILRFGTGIGFHYQSPVGPVNFDWGFKIKPRPNEDLSQFYFSIGVI